MERLIWFADPQKGIAGKLCRESEVALPVTTHVLHYGSSVFEGIKFYDAGNRVAILRLRDHTNRLFFSAGELGFKLAEHLSVEDVEKACIAAVAANAKEGLREGYLRPLVFCNGGIGLGSNLGKFAVAIMAAAFVKPKERSRGGVWVTFSSMIRPHPRSGSPRAKIGGFYANCLMALIEGVERGGSDPILEDHGGYLAEASSSNLFIVKGGTLITPDSDSILEGITRACVIEIARSLGIRVDVRPVRREELLSADEAFLSGTACEILPIGTVETTKIHDGTVGPITDRIWEIYVDAAHGRRPEFAHWLTPVPLD